MKLEKGMYVRYIRGAINGYVPPRIAKITDCSDKDLIKIDNGQVILRNDILKASHNIIDLIEEGDYVNGLPVTRIYIDDETNEKYLNMFGSISEYGSEDIKSIVTKEQFNSMKYEVDSNE